ncbi:MAG: hypothetical protein ACLUYK_05055, partial [Eggerthella lenta]
MTGPVDAARVFETACEARNGWQSPRKRSESTAKGASMYEVQKRDGKIAEFDIAKISSAIAKA